MCKHYILLYSIFSCFLMISVSSTECLSFKPNDLIILISFANLKWKLPKYCRAMNFKLFHSLFHSLFDSAGIDLPSLCSRFDPSVGPAGLPVCQNVVKPIHGKAQWEVRSRAVNYKTWENEKLLKITPQKLRNSFLECSSTPSMLDLSLAEVEEGWNVKKKGSLAD